MGKTSQYIYGWPFVSTLSPANFRSSLLLATGFLRLNALVHRSVLTLLWNFGNPCSNRIEIDISRTGQNRRFICQFLAFEASLPKSASTFVFRITASRDRFGQCSHPPGNIAETAPQLLTSSRRHKQLQLTFGRNCRCLIFILSKREQLPPRANANFG